MATSGPSRKRQPHRERLTAEDDALNQIAREAEARLAAKRAARVEAREIRMKELDRQQKEGAHAMSSLSAAALTSLGESSSKSSSGDTSISVDTEASIREMKDLLTETEEKYKKAIVSNAQLDNEKTNFMYQVDSLKDVLLELEEQLAESKRQYEEKSKELERQKYAHSMLQFQFNKVKEILQQREEVLLEHGIILNFEISTNGETSAKNEGHFEPSAKVNLEISPILKTTEAVCPSRTSEVKMKNESLEEEEKGEILQITENKEHKEDTETWEAVKAITNPKTLHHDEIAETKGSSGHDNYFIVTCANSRLEQNPSVSDCVFSAKSHDINELGKSKFLPSGEEVECVCNVKHESSETLQIQGSIIDQRWVHKPETQIVIQSWGKMKQQGIMDKERESCNEEFQDALDFVANSNEKSITDLLALEDESNEETVPKEIETYNSVKIKIINQCKNESNAKNCDLERQQEECFDMTCDKVECFKIREGSRMEEVQSWEIPNNSAEWLKGTEVDCRIISNEIGQKPTKSEKTNNGYQSEDSNVEQIRESMISPGDHSQEKDTKIQVQAIKDIKKKSKKEKTSKKDIVKTEITQAETPVKFQCSHDVTNSILEKNRW
uniref:Leucine-rich repeat flightless-interacting protein 1 n=1 Tax=Geotrypetes seraphini TaxID=260995 RepID=A0A6P8RHZ6_GEOSA|nr:leucine-rich repeat flightless-interacting protein 1 [Geotrypetes seraphini]